LVDTNAENQKYNSDRLEKILIQALATNGRVNELEKKEISSKEQIKDLKEEIKEEIKDLKDEITKLQEDNHINKGKATIINMLIGGAGAIAITIIGASLKFFKIFK